MTLLKRFELWLLLILIGGGLYYVLNLSDPEQTAGQRPSITSVIKKEIKTEAIARFTLQKVIISRDENHFLIEIEVLCRNTHDKTLTLASTNTQLFAANGQAAATFFLPFQAPNEVPASSEQTVTLRYWLNLDDLTGPISLKIDGENLKIKNSTFDSATLVDKESLTFTNANWTRKP